MSAAIYASDPNAAPEVVAELESAVRRFDRELVVDDDPAAREETLRRIERTRRDARNEAEAVLIGDPGNRAF